MKKINLKSKIIALSTVAVSSIALVSYAGTDILKNRSANDTTINLNVDKVDRDTVKIYLDNLADDIKSLQLSLKIDGSAKFTGEDSIKWLLNNEKNNINPIQVDSRITESGKYLDLIIVSDESLDKNGPRLDICEIDVTSVGGISKSESGYKVLPRENNGAAYTYVMSSTNRSKSGKDIINPNSEYLKINSTPEVSLKNVNLEGFVVDGNKISVDEGYDFAAGFESNKNEFVVIKDDDLNDPSYNEKHTIKFEGDVNTAKPSSYNIKIVVTDSFGEKAEMDAIVEVKPAKITQPPTITGVRKEHTIKSGEVFDIMEGVGAKDAKQNAINVVIEGDFDLNKGGVYTIKFIATDRWGNVAEETMTLTVIEDKSPIISGAVDKTIERDDSFDPLEGIVVKDDKDKDIQSKLKVTGDVNTKVTGDYKLSYYVIDSGGNEARAQRTITVVPKVVSGGAINSAPEILGVKDQTINVGDTFDPRKGVTARDKEDGNLTDKIVISSDVNTSKEGQYKVVYTVSDKNGAKVTKTATITVKKSEQPGRPEEENKPGEIEKPEQPGNPEGENKPGEIEKPEQPGNQDGETKPGDTEKPEQPGNQDGETKPGDTEKPGQPGNPGESEGTNNPVDKDNSTDNTDNKEGSVETSDASIMGYIGILVVALGLLIFIKMKKRK